MTIWDEMLAYNDTDVTGGDMYAYGNDTIVTTELVPTGPTPKYPGWNVVGVFGLGTYVFYLIHGTALIVLAISIVCSGGVLIYLNIPCKKNFFTRPIGERLVVYLAFCDLMFSLSHTLDHSYMTITLSNPPDGPCMLFGFLLIEFILSQAFIVSFTAVNALIMVGFGRKINLGRYDWKLVVSAFGIPALLCAIGASQELIGPAGPWCFIDLRNPYGGTASNVFSVMVIIAFIINFVCYFLVLAKMKAVEQKLKKGPAGGGGSDSSSSTKYHSVARIMMLFVAVFIIQYAALCIFNLWAMIGSPTIGVIWCVVFFSNIGGLLNFIAYTIVRKRQQAVATGKQAPETTKSGTA